MYTVLTLQAYNVLTTQGHKSYKNDQTSIQNYLQEI